MLRSRICEILEIEYPIIQGGMAWLGTAELASAVSNAGGLGIIGSGNCPPEWVRDQIKKTRERTSKPFGVNIMLMSPHVEEVIEVVIEEKVPVVAFGGGNPGVYIRRLKEAGIKIMPVVSSLALAQRLERLGVDIIVAEGLEAGGHIGEVATMILTPYLARNLSVPVVAAGGICDGKGLATAMLLGAQGVQMGTRFICTPECIAHPKFKERILQAGERDTVVTGRSIGHPVRVLKNKMARKYLEMERAGTPKEVLEKFGEGRLYRGVIEGDIEEGSLMAGQVSALIKDIKPVKEIVEGMIDEAETSLSIMRR